MDPTKRGEFFVQLKLVKGFRYRYSFEVDGREILDETSPKSVDRQGTLTNYIEVKSVAEENMTVQDFLSSQYEEGGADGEQPQQVMDV